MRLVIIADLHSGHRTGLTHPDHDTEKKGAEKRFAEVRARLWAFYAERMKVLQPIDCLVVNGDAIDGKGERSGGTELIEADRGAQVEMAAAAILEAKARKVYVLSGTPYHVGKEDDFEAVLAHQVHASHYGAHDWLDCAGTIFDFKHKVNSSVIPHGRFTAPQRAALWNALWAERGIQPRSDVLIRSHVHYFTHSGDGRRLVMTTPALQAWTKFGSKECEGTNDIGFLSFDCDNGGYTWKHHALEMKWAAVRPYKV